MYVRTHINTHTHTHTRQHERGEGIPCRGWVPAVDCGAAFVEEIVVWVSCKRLPFGFVGPAVAVTTELFDIEGGDQVEGGACRQRFADQFRCC